MRTDVALQYEALWQTSDAPPDVFAYLEQQDYELVSDRLSVLLKDQSLRWQTSEPISVEDYLRSLPELETDRYKLELAVGEFRARQQVTPSPSVEEFTSRFAEISDDLRGKLLSVASSDMPTQMGGRGDHSRTKAGSIELARTRVDESETSQTYGGRYRIDRVLGEGGFGRVYLAFDTELRRQVALKVPTPDRFRTARDADVYLAEARNVASLDHPNIVPVFDMGRTDDGSIYVVSKYIEGQTLTDRIKTDRPTPAEAAKLVATVAFALHHAHERHLIHRDVKPGNILLDEAGTPYVADFGLAVREEDYLVDSRMVGTPAYMSPEQARCEGHRLDGRSDVFSLGVVFYQMLAGQRPFRGGTTNELLYQVISTDPPNLIHANEKVPAELERICLKALSKRASDRYASAAQFADDLLSWQQEPAQQSSARLIVPKGLRSFDSDDADYFLDLLPGPRGRDGLPEGIGFWKTRVEETDPTRTFGVGLIYGPSGCGKSSVVKAGLLPRLSKDVNAFYLEATPSDTENRILRGLRKRLPDLPRDLGLVEAFSFLRRDANRKVVIVLDQFEQWLHSHRGEENTELVRALRQCDGGRLQAVVMVRDDFSMAASRFMRELEARILEGHNFATVDLFDIRHAEKVLLRFGQAFGRVPLQDDRVTDDQRTFVSEAANGLARDGKVICVRLALFAEMVKGKEWTPLTLREVGGTGGIGVHFLEETFSNRQANPEHRAHQQAARHVLMALLPEVGSDIKGHMRSQQELLEVSGYGGRQADFKDLMLILDGKLRLITPTDPNGLLSESTRDQDRDDYYQLTHDYLVPPLREWLTRQQRATKRGRGELKLSERSSIWNATPENRYLPSFGEWAGIRWLTDPDKWSGAQRSMMNKARRLYGTRCAMLLATMVLVYFVASHIRDRVAEADNEATASFLVRNLADASIDQVPGIIEGLSPYRKWVDPKLDDQLQKYGDDTSQRLNLSLGLLPSDVRQVDYVRDRLLLAEPRQIPTIRSLLAPRKDAVVDHLWRVARTPRDGEEKQLLQAVSGLAEYAPDDDARWAEVSDRVVDALVDESSLRAAVWTEMLKPARRHLIGSLASVFRNRQANHSQSRVDLATDILEEYAADDLDQLADLLWDADTDQFVALFDEFAAHENVALESARSELDRELSFSWNDPPPDPSWTSASPEIRKEIEQADGLLNLQTAFCQTMAMDRFLDVSEALRQSGFRPVRMRPYPHEGSVLIAAAWHRDGIEWHMKHDLSAGELEAENSKLREDGFSAVDIAGYTGRKDAPDTDQYCCVWAKRSDDERDSRIYVGASHEEVGPVRKALDADGYRISQSVQAFRRADGQRLFSGIRQDVDLPSVVMLHHTGYSDARSKGVDEILWDIDLSRARSPVSSPGDATSSAQPITSGERRETPFVIRVLNPRTSFESRDLMGLSPPDHLDEARSLLKDGYRIKAVSVTSIDGKPVAASAWHRPLIQDDAKEIQAKRKANAAIAALLMDNDGELWPLLEHSPDPRLRSWILHRLGPSGVSAEAIVDRLRRERNVSIQRALIWALGLFERDAIVELDSVIELLADLYRDDPDPGIHSASEWAIRSWGESPVLEQIVDRTGTGSIRENRRWFINSQRQTFAVIPSAVDYLMGSPSTERDRDSFEYLHPQRVGRGFAIATKEVTVSQFQEFLKDFPGPSHRYAKRHAPVDDCPQVSVTWYEAAAYCRWLSEQENVDDDQMCYPPLDQIKEGMKLPDDYLSRTGYRLPTEAEWEYACRANTLTSRSFGESEELLGKYAWYSGNSDYRSSPVGQLLPNDLGLFDMHGNVQEWCQERHVTFKRSSGITREDREDLSPLKVDDRRLLRGGAYGIRPNDVRSAHRSYNRPANRYNNSGFRPARTLPFGPR